MKNKQQMSPKLSALFLFSLLILNAGISLATTKVSLEPETLRVDAGEKFDLGLFIDFGTDKTTSGALDIAFDSTFIGFNSFEFDPNFTRAKKLDNIDPQTENLVSIVFGSLDDIEGAFKIGTLTFTATSTPGTTPLTLSTSPKWGGFKDLIVEPGIAQVEVAPQVIPLPGALWLFGSALIGVISLNRKKANF